MILTESALAENHQDNFLLLGKAHHRGPEDKLEETLQRDIDNQDRDNRLSLAWLTLIPPAGLLDI